MIQKNPLISRQGFTYLTSILGKGYSKTTLCETLDSLVIDFGLEPQPFQDGKEDLKKARKTQQINGLMQVIKRLGPYENIVEIGCGKGRLSRVLAYVFPDSSVIGIDHDPGLLSGQEGYPKNIHLEEADEFDYLAPIGTDLVVSLHGCGNLTDRVIDIAVHAGADVICVPCCYGRIKRKENQQGDYFLPRSSSLSDLKEDFRGKVLKRNRILDGTVKEGRGTIRNIVLDLHRLLVNFDRLLFMKEKGYDVGITAITPLYIPGSNHINSPHRYAILGKSR